MRKLISAGAVRLKKDKLFWGCLVILLLYSALVMLNGCRQALAPGMQEYHYGLDHYYYSYCLPIGFFCAVFISLYLGTEYRDGTLRNKVIAGYARWEIYLSGFTVSLGAVFLMLLSCLVGGLVGIPFLGPWQNMQRLAVYLLISFLYTAAFAAVFTLVSMLFSYRSLSQVLSVLLLIGLLLFAGKLFAALQEPEKVSDVTISAEDGMHFGDPSPNPNYVEGSRREVYDFIVDLLPTGQCLKMYGGDITDPLRNMLLSLGITAGTTAAGIALFKRKDLY